MRKGEFILQPSFSWRYSLLAAAASLGLWHSQEFIELNNRPSAETSFTQRFEDGRNVNQAAPKLNETIYTF